MGGVVPHLHYGLTNQNLLGYSPGLKYGTYQLVALVAINRHSGCS